MYYAGDITGKQYGEWTVLRKYEGSKHNNPKWVCRCSCGVEKPVLTYALVHGISKNCGSPIHMEYIGKKYGSLTVLPKWERRGNRIYFLCKCDCGVEKYIAIHHLIEGKSSSCGCKRRQMTIDRNTKHNLSNTRLFNIWEGMKSRCNDKNNKDYGGRGITVCIEWSENFESFYEWSMSNGYAENLSIDRIDNDGPYAPWNCRWVTQKIQANNTRTNIYIDYKGERLTLKQIWDKYANNNISYSRFQTRYRKLGWDLESALSISTKPKSITANGETHTISEWSKITGINASTIYLRLECGWNECEAVTNPLYKRRGTE